MENKSLVTARGRLDVALNELEDIVEEAQQNHHAFISQTTNLRRILKAIYANITIAEHREQST